MTAQFDSETLCFFILVVCFLGGVFLALGQKPKVKEKIITGILDQVLLMWTDRDPFRIRDLLNGGVLVLGRAGSGKTSSSGRTLMQAIVNHPRSGGLILCAKPEDAADIHSIFLKAGRI
jgi:hypothetical protein